MAFDADSVFLLLQESYASGLLEKLVAVAGEALDGLILDTGLSVGDLLALVDGISRESVLAAESKVAASEPAQVLQQLALLAEEPAGAAIRLRDSLEKAVANAGAAREV